MDSKNYIGHGTKHNEWNIIDVVLDVEKAMGHTFEYEGKRYLKVSVAARRERSQYGSTHSVYVRTKTETEPIAEPAPEKPKRSRKAKA